MSPVPRALSRARLWTSGLLTASTLLVGGIGVHLAQDHAAAVATTSSTTTTTSSGSSGTSGTDDASNGSDASSADTSSSSSSGSSGGSDTSNQSSGFQAVVPLSGSGAQAQSGSGGS